METQYWPQRPPRANGSAVSANRFLPKIDEASAQAGAIVESVRAPRVLLSVEDISEQRAGERRTAELLRQKEILLQETQQRIANNLQVVAGILLLKARAVQSEAARLYLQDTHQRPGIMEQGEQIEIAPYLSRFCETQAIAPVGGSRPITIEGQADSSRISRKKSVSIRRLAAELVVNALKRAFVSDRAAPRTVVAQEMEEPRWRLIVSDTGAGMSKGVPGKASPGLRAGRERNGSC
ncbi:sensor histidine kinase [Fodinicurvata fenggangensis]|uniref:sensor histidine kinase n=1 Tax=Fodinicurvata fenggangensis TaxID=1121830 RepID=UPI00138DEF32|nr:sensor histidine kinase [Fodinicurvata fenggangensis]